MGLFNGVPLSTEEMDPDELETILLQHIMDATNFFQRAVFMVFSITILFLMFLNVRQDTTVEQQYISQSIFAS